MRWWAKDLKKKYKKEGCCLTAPNLLLSVQLHQLYYNIDALVHSFYRDVLIRPMVGMSSGSKIRTGQSFEA